MKMPTVDISSDRDFDLFYELISKKAPAISDTGEPGLPKKWNKPNYFLLQDFGDRREASNSDNAYHPSSVHQHFKVISFKAIDSITSTIKDPFEKRSFNLCSNVEQLLLKPINGEDYQQELHNFLKIVRDDIDLSPIPTELSMISTICKEGNPAHVDDVLSILKAFSRNERLVMKNVITIVKSC